MSRVSAEVEVGSEKEHDEMFVSVPLNAGASESSQIDNQEQCPEKEETVSPPKKSCKLKWSKAMVTIKAPLIRLIVRIANHAARHPKSYVFCIIAFSMFMIILGLMTNFSLDSDDEIWTPRDSYPAKHSNWIDDESGFPPESRYFVLVVHRDGDNVLGPNGNLAQEGASRVFQALDAVRNTDGYRELCAQTEDPEDTDPFTGEPTCDIVSITTFWNESTSTFKDQVNSNEEAIVAMSSDTFPSGRPVDFKQIIGYAKFVNATGLLTYGQSYVTVIQLPAQNDDVEKEAEDFEKDALDNVLDLQDEWDAQERNDFRLDVIAYRSWEDEFERAVVNDVILLPIVFIFMSVLCIIIFAKRDKVQSRTLLGFGAVVTVLLALCTSFGLLFTCGIPFTSLTMILPFIMFGVGLDDAFIISGSYFRKDPNSHPVDRIDDTMSDIGGSILLTTLTATAAFALGCISSIPAVMYLVTYAWPTILIDFIYQITFFVALIVIDERRIDENRYDCLVCRKAPERDEDDETNQVVKAHFADRIMAKYSVFLLRPWVKAVVVLIFVALLGIMSYSVSQLKQAFDFTEVIPSDSYIQTWWTAYNEYYEHTGSRPGVYFRYLDFSNINIQDQMEHYVNDLANLTQFSGPPFEFWLWDFRQFVDEANLGNLTFDEQLKAFLNVTLYYDTYNDDIVLDDGTMISSRTTMHLDGVDYEDVKDQVRALEDQRAVTRNQTINKDRKDWAFFTYTEDYDLWEFYRVVKDELILSTVLGVVTVSLLGGIFIPHWSAIFFVGPLVVILYIDLLGAVQFAGINVNPVMYIGMVMSIGLMVDYVMHFTLRFMETKGDDRDSKTKGALESIGGALFVGGVSTVLGVLPLAFSTSEIFMTVFVIFFSLVTLGLAHGLILLPVVLSFYGPMDGFHEDDEEEIADTKGKKDQLDAECASDVEAEREIWM